MNPDRAAELLQIPERGLDLLTRFEEDGPIAKAIQAVQAGFAPRDVAAMYGIAYEETEADLEGDLGAEGSIHVYECQSSRCRLKGRVATCSLMPDDENFEPELVMCPGGCRQPMVYVTSVEHEDDIGNLRRAFRKRANIHDSMHGVDRAGADSRDILDDD